MNSRHYSMTEQEWIIFFKRLAFLRRAGVSLPEALSMLKEQAHTKRTRTILENVYESVSSGKQLSESLNLFSNGFSHTTTYAIAAGETTGTLAQTLERLADTLAKHRALKRKVMGAFIYPVIITVVMVGVIGFLVLYLFPKIMPIFSSLHMQLPFATRVVIGASTFLMEWGLWCGLLVAAVSFAFFIFTKRNMRGKYFFDQAFLRVPVLASLVQNYNVINSARTLELLLASVPLSAALARTAESIAHAGYKNAWRDIAASVERGESIAKAMAHKKKYFPDTFVQLVAVGEHSGSLSETLHFLSEWYEGDLEERTKQLSTLIEPVLMIVMGLVIGFVALSIILPIYGITQNLHA